MRDQRIFLRDPSRLCVVSFYSHHEGTTKKPPRGCGFACWEMRTIFRLETAVDSLNLSSLEPDMSDAEFEVSLKRVADWVRHYRNDMKDMPVLSSAKPGDLLRSLPQEPPQDHEPIDAWLRDLDRIVLPAMTHWNHPGFLAYFGTTGSAPGILGELVGAVLNVNGMMWRTCPASTELEEVVLRWYRQALGLPLDWFGMMTDTASTSTLVALAAAREHSGLNVREVGLSGQPPLVLYCSEEAHSSVDKAALVLGLGTRGIHRVPTDEKFAMRVDALEEAIEWDCSNNRLPFAVVATVGTTSSTAVDPVAEIAEVCRRHHLWLHVDAAYAGSAAVAPEFRWALNGCERADSFVTNPHKWLFTPVDCSALFTSRPDEFRKAFSLTPEYLRASTAGVIDYMDYSFQLGRRFRAIKLWFVFRHFGTQGIAERIRHHVRMAQEFASWVDDHPEMERLAPVPFSVVCFRAHPKGVDEESRLEKLNASVLEMVNSSGEVFISHTKLRGRYTLRLAVGNLQTTRDRVRKAFDLVLNAASKVCR